MGDPLHEDFHDEPAHAELRAFSIDRPHHGARLDKALADAAPEFSRSYLQQLIEAGAVMLNGLAVHKPSARVKAGDSGTVELRPTQQSQAFVAQPMDIPVLYEDEHLLVVDKPAGLVVHPAAGNWSGTLLNGLLARDAASAALPRAGIVHRLDKDTSGLMVVARSRTAMDALVRMIAAREITRQYLALAHRPWSGPVRRRIVAAIGRDPRNRLRMAVVDLARNSGKEAATVAQLLQDAEEGCLVGCTLETGRTHQIRVHMAHVGHPLVGDVLYGGKAAGGQQRQALHAFRLAFAHPVGAAPMEFISPLPADLRQTLGSWGLETDMPALQSRLTAPEPTP